MDTVDQELLTKAKKGARFLAREFKIRSNTEIVVIADSPTLESIKILRRITKNTVETFFVINLDKYPRPIIHIWDHSTLMTGLQGRQQRVLYITTEKDGEIKTLRRQILRVCKDGKIKIFIMPGLTLETLAEFSTLSRKSS